MRTDREKTKVTDKICGKEYLYYLSNFVFLRSQTVT